MAIVGDASVIVRAITTSVKRDIEKAFRDARANIRKEGEAAGKEWADGVKKSIGNSDIAGSIRNNLGSSSVHAAAGNAGASVGRAFADSVENSVADIDISDSLGSALGNSVQSAVDDATDQAGEELESGMRDAGGRGGRGFLSGFLSSGFANAAVAASRSFTTMLVASNVLGPAIAGLVSALSAAASGLYAMASAASVAAGALGVLPGMIGIAIQSMATLKLAFSGVGDAIKLGTEAQEAQTASNAASAASAYAVADAQKALERARTSAGDAAYDAANRVADAERDVASAQSEVLSAQRALNDARREAIESLQELAFQAEGAGLAEERAALRLEEAHEKLKLAQQLPADNRARREAELAFKEAELGYRMAKDRNSDLEKEQKRASKAGVRGSQEVVAARERINSAQEKLANAEEQLADARLARQRQQRDSTLAIADAEERLRRAQEASASAMSDAAKKADEYEAALEKLGKPAANFVRYLVSLQDEFKGLKVAAGEGLFPRLQDALEPIVDNLFPVLENQLRETGKLLGEGAKGVGQMFDTQSTNRFKQVLEGNNEILGVFTKRGKDGENTFSRLARLLLRLLVAVQPLTKRFAEWIDELVKGWAAATRTNEQMDKLTGFFNKAGDRAALLGEIFGNIWGILVNLGKAADKSGVSLLESLASATEDLEKWLGKDATQDKLGRSFEVIADNLRAIGDLIVVVGREFFGLADNAAIGEAATGLIPFVENLGEILDRLTTATPALSGFATSVSELMLNLTETGTIDKMLVVMTKIVDIFASIAGSDAGRKILIVAGSIAAFTRPIGLALRILGFFFKAIVGGPIAVARAVGKLARFPGRLLASWRVLRGGGGLRAAFGALSTGSDKAKIALEKQMVTDKKKTGVLKALETQALKTAAALGRMQVAGAPIPATGAKAAQVGAAGAAAPGAHRGPGRFRSRLAGRNEAGFIAPSVAGSVDKASKTAGKSVSGAGAHASRSAGKFSRLGKVAGAVAKGPFKLLRLGLLGISRGLLAILGPIGIVIAVGYLLYKFFQDLYKKSPEFRKFVDAIVEKLSQLGDWFKKIYNDHIIPAMEAFFGWLNDNMPAIKKFFQDLWDKIIAVKDGIVKAWNAVAGEFRKQKKQLEEDIQAIKDAFTKMRETAERVVDNVKRKWKDFQDAVQELKDKIDARVQDIKDAWDKFVKKIEDGKNAIVNKWLEIRRAIFDMVDRVKEKWNDFQTKLEELKDKIGEKVQAIKDFFGGIPEAVASAFANLGSNAKRGINAFIDLINEHLIGKINDKLGVIGIEIPEIPRMAKGGRVKGQGGPTEDNQLRRLSAGEYVIPTRIARQLGYQTLDFIRRYGRLPAVPFAAGGVARATSGGVYAQLAEAGYNERVEPLGRDGLSARDRALLNMMRDLLANSGGDTWQIHPAPGMDEAELAHNIYQKVRFNRRAGK